MDSVLDGCNVATVGSSVIFDPFRIPEQLIFVGITHTKIMIEVVSNVLSGV